MSEFRELEKRIKNKQMSKSEYGQLSKPSPQEVGAAKKGIER